MSFDNLQFVLEGCDLLVKKSKTLKTNLLISFPFQILKVYEEAFSAMSFVLCSMFFCLFGVANACFVLF